ACAVKPSTGNHPTTDCGIYQTFLALERQFVNVAGGYLMPGIVISRSILFAQVERIDLRQEYASDRAERLKHFPGSRRSRRCSLTLRRCTESSLYRLAGPSVGREGCQNRNRSSRDSGPAHRNHDCRGSWPTPRAALRRCAEFPSSIQHT